MKCQCGHAHISHRYLALVGENSGECLARGCDCVLYEEESP